jgi:transcriptional regulator with GAF, ATPase, and Fis domain
VGEIFSADATIVMMYDAERDWVSNIYYVDRGQHIAIPDQPGSRQTLGSILVDRHKPLLVGSRAESRTLGSLPILRAGENEDRNESYLGVPILVGEKVIGLVSVQSHEKNIFDQDDLRLLQTLANSMSVALENARLFNETQRLLKETEQRAAELAIINSVQLGVAAQLDLQGIYDAVGDKIREIFDQADVGIRIYDPQKKIVYFPYEYSNGRRVTIDSVTHMNPEELLTATGFVPHVFRTRATLVINENMPQEVERFGSSVLPGTQMEKSAVYVPLVIGDQVRGVIIIMDVEHEHAFSASCKRLPTA